MTASTLWQWLRGRQAVLLMAALALAGVLYVKYAMAATYTVNTTADTSGST